MPVKCPKCRKIFRTQATYMKHFAAAHYKSKKKADKKKVVVGKIPVWAKKGKKRR